MEFLFFSGSSAFLREARLCFLKRERHDCAFQKREKPNMCFHEKHNYAFMRSKSVLALLGKGKLQPYFRVKHTLCFPELSPKKNLWFPEKREKHNMCFPKKVKTATVFSDSFFSSFFRLPVFLVFFSFFWILVFLVLLFFWFPIFLGSFS